MIVNCKNQNTIHCQRLGLVTTYFNDIRKYKILSKSEEKDLLIKAHSGDNKVRNEAVTILVNSNQRFVASAAMKYANSDNLLDLVNEANIGLICAIDKFNLDKDVRLITYAAWWIQKSINDYLTEYGNIVTPANANKLRFLTNKVRQEFFTKEHRTPTLEEVQNILRDEYDFNVNNLTDLEVFQSISIDETASFDGEEESFNENPIFTNATASNNIDDDIEEDDNKVIVKNLLCKLNEKDKFIITKYYGIGCHEESCDTIAAELNLTKERIRQKINEIIKELSKFINND